MTDKQPEALRLANALDGGPHSMEIEHQAAALLRAQHADIERKDALLRQALETLNLHQGAHPGTYRQAIEAITKEISQ